MLFNLEIPKDFNFGGKFYDFCDLEIKILNSRNEVDDIDNTDNSCWELKCPETVDCVFIMARSKHVTCIKLVKLDPNNKTLYLEIDVEPEVIPLTLILIGLQTITNGGQHYHVVQAEGYTEITDELSTMELNLIESKGSLCGSKLFELEDKKGAEIVVKHRFGSKYWIKTEPSGKSQTTKYIIMQDLETEDTYFFFTENTWKFKSIPFTLRPCSQYRCMTYYGTKYHSEDEALSFRSKSASEVEFSKNNHLYRTSKVHTFTAYMTKSELQKLFNKGANFVKKTINKFHSIKFFYRNKSVEYFEDIFRRKDGVMTKHMKDNNGDRYSIINKNLEGLFFSALLEQRTLKPPPTSIFGPRRLFVNSSYMLNTRTNLYFADFYCNFYVHYITLVITRPNSPADKFCQGRLIKVNLYDNPFIKLVINHGEYSPYVTTNVHIELFYTECIDLQSLRKQQDGFLFEDVPIRGKGTSCAEGIAKKAGCKICNL